MLNGSKSALRWAKSSSHNVAPGDFTNKNRASWFASKSGAKSALISLGCRRGVASKPSGASCARPTMNMPEHDNAPLGRVLFRSDATSALRTRLNARAASRLWFGNRSSHAENSSISPACIAMRASCNSTADQPNTSPTCCSRVHVKPSASFCRASAAGRELRNTLRNHSGLSAQSRFSAILKSPNCESLISTACVGMVRASMESCSSHSLLALRKYSGSALRFAGRSFLKIAVARPREPRGQIICPTSMSKMGAVSTLARGLLTEA